MARKTAAAAAKEIQAEINSETLSEMVDGLSKEELTNGVDEFVNAISPVIEKVAAKFVTRELNADDLKRLTPEQEAAIRKHLGANTPSVFDAIPGVAPFRHKNMWLGVSQALSAGLGVGAGYFGAKRWG
jgi:hypothetical protein